MNAIIRNLPQPLLENYILRHASELSVDDFFQISTKARVTRLIKVASSNENLKKEPRVLNYFLDKKIGISSLDFFSEEAFSKENISKLASEINNSYYADVITEHFPFLLSDSEIVEKVISYNPSLIRNISQSLITDKVISILEETHFTPTKNDIENIPIFLTSKKLINNAIKEDSSVILLIDQPSELDIKTALENGFEFTKEYFIQRPSWLENSLLLESAFKIDPSMIVYFKEEELTEEIISSALERGFIPKEEHLIQNPSLCNNRLIMESAIQNDYKLILYTGDKCQLDWNLIYNAMSNITITKEDLDKHPMITRNWDIMKLAPESLKKIYSPSDEEEKIKVVFDVLKTSKTLSLDTVPFLDSKFSGLVNIEDINELLKYIGTNIDENDVVEQKKYKEILDKVIDGIIDYKYSKEKHNFKYSDAGVIYNSILNAFTDAVNFGSEKYIDDFIQNIHEYTGGLISIDEIKQEVYNLYNIFKENNNFIEISSTNQFCTKILNEKRNYYFKEEKKELDNELLSKINLNDKKTEGIIIGRKIKKIEGIISLALYDESGITREDVESKLDEIGNFILSDKKIKKLAIISGYQMELLKHKFLETGVIKTTDLYDIGIFDPEKAIDFIIKHFNGIKRQLADKVTLSDSESVITNEDKESIGGLNAQQFKIVDSDRYLLNLSTLIVKLDSNRLEDILKNKEMLDEIKNLIPLLGLLDDFDVDMFIKIISKYSLIKDKVGKEDTLGNLTEIIQLSEAYNSTDDITSIVLTDEVTSCIGANNPNMYLMTLEKMYDKKDSSIPNVSVKTGEMTYESGYYTDPERLLIQHIPKQGHNSCISPETEMGQEVLFKKDGDMILIKKNGKPISRYFLVRRGNVVQIISRGGEHVSSEVVREISKQIIQQSIENGDNLEYVVMDSYSLNEQGSLKDTRFVSRFPHADISDSVTLLCSKKMLSGEPESEIKIDFDVEPKCAYRKERKKISYDPSSQVLTRIRALNIAMEKDEQIKAEKSQKFEKVFVEDYKKVLCGEDWYLGIKNDGTIEKIILPVNDERQTIEIEMALNMLQSMGEANAKTDKSKAM